MKKILLIFIVLVILAGAGLYFGWVNIKPGFYGVAFSSITGIENYPLKSGSFHWFWQKLIPKSFKLYIIDNTPSTFNFNYSTALPGSKDMKDFGSFNIGIDGKIRYRIDFESAKILITDGIIENQKNYFKDLIENNIENDASKFILQIFNNFNNENKQLDYSILNILKDSIEKDINKDLSNYGLKDIKLSINYASIPQIDVYSRALQLYMQYVGSLYQAKKAEITRKAETTAKYEKNKAELTHLEDIGIIIKKYPGLLKYMYIQKLGDKIKVIVLPEGKSGFPSIVEPEVSLVKKKMSPLPENESSLPELKQKIPESPKPTESTEHLKKESSVKGESKISESSISKIGKKKEWYEYLKFWEYIGKKSNQ